MATVTMETDNYVQQIGETAGDVWNTLSSHGPISLTRLVKLVGAPRDTVMQSLGWLAREDKIAIEEEGRSRLVMLR